jgi:hypothetical protein
MFGLSDDDYPFAPLSGAFARPDLDGGLMKRQFHCFRRMKAVSLLRR